MPRFRTAEQLQILSSKPLFRLQRFAAMLNWRGLQLSCTLLTDEEMKTFGRWKAGIAYAYVTPDLKFNIHIHELDEPPFTHKVTVVADRYGLWSQSHPFTLFEDNDKLIEEAKRLKPLVDRTLFKNKKWRDQFLRENPDRLLLKTKDQFLKKWEKQKRSKSRQ